MRRLQSLSRAPPSCRIASTSSASAGLNGSQEMRRSIAVRRCEVTLRPPTCTTSAGSNLRSRNSKRVERFGVVLQATSMHSWCRNGADARAPRTHSADVRSAIILAGTRGASAAARSRQPSGSSTGANHSSTAKTCPSMRAARSSTDGKSSSLRRRGSRRVIRQVWRAAPRLPRAVRRSVHRAELCTIRANQPTSARRARPCGRREPPVPQRPWPCLHWPWPLRAPTPAWRWLP